MGTFTMVQQQSSNDLFLIPEANGCNIDFTPVGEANNWECVDDPRDMPDNDITYVYSSASLAKYDLYELPNHTTETGTINYVQVYARGKSQEFAQHEDGIYKILLTDNACVNIFKSDDVDLAASTYKTYNKVWTANERTGDAFTWDEIDDLEIGVECSSPSVTRAPTILTIRPSACDTCGLAPSVGGRNDQWELVDDEVQDGYDTYIYATEDQTKESLFALDDTAKTGVISNVAIFACINPDTKPDDHYGRTLIKTHGTQYYGDAEYVPATSWTWISTNYFDNPNTTNAWTWAEIDALCAGIELTSIAGNLCSCTSLYVVISYTPANSNPEIRTTQSFLKVNYTPPEVTCTMDKPEEISIDHEQNIKMMNFWDGSREVYGLSRSKRTMAMRGKLYSETACTTIECVRDMGISGEDITLSDLGSNNFDKVVKIRSFGWKKISKKPLAYEWILECEFTKCC